MSPIPASRFRHTLVAVAVVALTSGCATTASDPARGGDGITDSIARAGQKTVGFGQSFVHRAGYLLGLHDDPGVPVAERAETPPGPSPARPAAPGPATLAARPAPAPSGVPVARLPLNFDEVDLALMEEDAVMPGDGAAGVAPAAPPDDDDLLAGFDDADMMDVLPFEDAAPVLGAPGDAPAVADPLDPLGLAAAPPAPAPAPAPASASASASAPAPGLAAATPGDAPAGTDAAAEAVAVVAAADLEHRVGESETLWDIAKETTGDATNWHVLADVNDLGPGASVYPGQTLTIPADMLRPELAGGDALASASTGAPAPAPAVDADVAPAATDVPTGRLVVPDGPSPVAPPVTEPADGAREFEIAAGETLWDFAKRTTGDATNWQAIATQNGFDESQAVAVRAGQRVFVPQDLVEEEGAVATAVPTVAAVPVEAAPVATAPAAGGDGPRFVPIPQVGDARGVDEAVDASATALAAANGADAASGADAPAGEDVRIVEASFTGGPEADLPADPAAGTESVMISGTYYPKAVYSDADFSAGLVTRVSPGTRLKVSSVDGQWYRVETERGAGWVHQRDIK